MPHNFFSLKIFIKIFLSAGFVFVLTLNGYGKDMDYSKVTQDQLIEKSRIIILAKPIPAQDTILKPEPCLAVAHAYQIKYVLRNDTDVNLKEGEMISVAPALFHQYQDLCSRVGWVIGFARSQYIPEKTPQPDEDLVLFLDDHSDNSVSFYAIDSFESGSAFESIYRKQKIYCSDLSEQYENFVKNLDRTCEKDSDCQIFQEDEMVGLCKVDTISNKELTPFQKQILNLLKTSDRADCLDRLWPSCKNGAVVPVCRDHLCFNSKRQPESSRFTFGEINYGCGVDDGRTIEFEISLKDDPESYIYIQNENIPFEIGQPFRMEWPPAPKYSSRFCWGKDVCSYIVKGFLKFDKVPDKDSKESAEGEFDFELENNNRITGKVIFHWGARMPLCG